MELINKRSILCRICRILWLSTLFAHASGILPITEEKFPTVRLKNFPDDLLAENSENVPLKNSQKQKGDEDRKTLSHQIADGKYGLLHKEFFAKPIIRPGVLSYEENPEVPKDTSKNYGGLNESEIWLAENHLLILRGGFYPMLDPYPEYSKPLWPPIDDYKAPRRQVKIPKNPKVPPPFPVQLTDGGPLQILGTNFTRTLNDSFYPPPYSVSPLEGYNPGEGPPYPPAGYPYPPDAPPGKGPFPIPPYPPPIPGNENLPGGKPPFPIAGNPSFESLPPGSVILPPPNNNTEFDEDDLSIYYPPPYSFSYSQENTTLVPPGPLVPGIVLPPPPDFFGALSTPPPSTTITQTKPTYSTTTTTTTTTTSRPPIRRPTITTKIKPIVPIAPSVKPPVINNIPNTPKRNKTVSVTILRPVIDPVKTKPFQPPPSPLPPIYVYENEIPNKPFEEYGPPAPNRYNKKVSVTTTRVPLRAYFTTSGDVSDAEIFRRLQEKHPEISLNPPKTQRKPQNTQIYYYDGEYDNVINPYSVRQPFRNVEQQRPLIQQTPVRHTPSQQAPVQQPQYVYVTQIPPYNYDNKPETFKAHLIKLHKEIEAYQQKSLDQYRPGPNIFEFKNKPQIDEVVPPSKPVYQYSFEAANYKQQHSNLRGQNQGFQNNRFNKVSPQYTVQIEPAIEITTTERPFYQQPYKQEIGQNRAPKYYRGNGNFNNNYQTIPQQHGYLLDPKTYVPNPYVVTPQPYLVTSRPHKTTPKPYNPIPTRSYKNYQNPSSYNHEENAYDDELTNTYFTTFGQKLPASSTPLPPSRHQVYNAPPRPTPQPPPFNIPQVQIRPQYQPIIQPNPLHPQRGNFNSQNVQTIRAISLPPRNDPEKSYISYQLPGDDGAHFYFLTPQVAQKRTSSEESSNSDESDKVAYYYAKPADASTY